MSASDSNKPSRRTQRTKIEARENAILVAAAHEFAAEGAEGAKMAAIARQAGIAEGTLYLYYRNKHELLSAVVGNFWDQLTEGAQQAVDALAPPFDQLRQLAHYHLQALIDQFELVGLTYRARQSSGRPEQELNQIRDYVRVFDGIIARAVDRNELMIETPLWQLRDIFFGTLEFSARTLKLRNQALDETLIDTLMHIFENFRPRTEDKRPSLDCDNQEIVARLDAIQSTLDKALLSRDH